MYKNITTSAILGGIAIILGAFGSHILKDKLSPAALDSFETAVRYQIYHVLLIIFINTNEYLKETEKNKISKVLFIGIFFFSGAIYAIQLLKIPAKLIWFTTPLGGLFLIFGWFLTAFYFFKKTKHYI